jgi:hypothetical protein
MRPDSMEAKLLHDADLLDLIGATGIVRLSAACNIKCTVIEALDYIKKHRDLAYKNLILDKSKELAEDKIKFMDDAIKQIEKELSDNGL